MTAQQEKKKTTEEQWTEFQADLAIAINDTKVYLGHLESIADKSEPATATELGDLIFAWQDAQSAFPYGAICVWCCQDVISENK